MFRAVKLRLYPNQEQAELFRKNCGCCRFIYNYFLDLKQDFYEITKTNLSNATCSAELTRLKQNPEYEWLQEVDSQSLQQSLRNLETAYKRFFKHISGYPQFKRKGNRDSFKCTQALNSDKNYLRIGKHGWIKCRGSWELLGNKKIRNITVNQDISQWYASCLIEVPYKEHHFAEHKICGIDLGVNKPLTVAYENLDGDVVTKVTGLQYSQDLEKKETKRKRYQRAMTRKTKSSANRAKAKHKVARAYQRERNFRKDWVEKTSFKLADLFKVVSFEDLSMKQMTKHGGNYKRKLNHDMRRLGLGMLIARTEQKVLERRGTVLYVDPAYTSQACSDCGSINKASRKSQARYQCVDCGFTLNADRNASINVLRRGQDYLKSLQ